MAIANLIIPYPDFVLGNTMDPDQFDANNEAIRLKVDEISTELNSYPESVDVVDTLSSQIIVGAKHFNTITVNEPTQPTQAVTRQYADSIFDVLNAWMVKLTGDQTVNGYKTFTNEVVVAEPTLDTHAATKSYVDSRDEFYDANTVKLTGGNSIGGINSFSDMLYVQGPTEPSHAATKFYVDGAIAGVVLGQVPDDSLTEAKMAPEMKKQAGGVYPYNSGLINANYITTNAIDISTNADDIFDNSQDIATNQNRINIITTAETDTGAANAYVVNTPATFARTDGNILPFIPSNDNTGASTINEDGNGVAPIKKYDGAAWVDVEAGDLKKFNKIDLVWNTAESAFQLAPKGGASIKNIQRGNANLPATIFSVDITISEVNLSSSVARISFKFGNTDEIDNNFLSIKFVNSTTIRIEREDDNDIPEFTWEVIEFNGVKSIQTGTTSFFNSSLTYESISLIDTSKSILVFSYRSNLSGTLGNRYWLRGRINSPAQLAFDTRNSTLTVTNTIEWQVIEFN